MLLLPGTTYPTVGVNTVTYFQLNTKTPSKSEKTCFCETFLRCTVHILLHKEMWSRGAERDFMPE